MASYIEGQETNSKPELAISPRVKNRATSERKLADADAPECVRGESLRDLFSLRSIVPPKVTERDPVPGAFDVLEPVPKLDGRLEQSSSPRASALTHGSVQNHGFARSWLRQSASADLTRDGSAH